MQFKQQSTANGKILVISDMNPGEWLIDDIASDITIGGEAYGDAIRSYNGLSDDTFADLVAIPVSWLNAYGVSIYNEAGPSKTEIVKQGGVLSIPISGAGAQIVPWYKKQYGGFTVLQLGLIGAGLLLVISAISRKGES